MRHFGFGVNRDGFHVGLEASGDVVDFREGLRPLEVLALVVLGLGLRASWRGALAKDGSSKFSAATRPSW